MTRKRTAISASLLLATGVSAYVNAQDSAQAPQMDEVIVTAQKRSQRLEDVPMSITMVGGGALEKAGIVNIQDLGRIAPGTQINFGGAYMAPAIRGITTLTNGNNIESNVAIFVDGFYEPNTVSMNADLANIDNVQVLKGPQGTLYGRNATGGAILINTRGPSETFTANVEAGFGRFDEKQFNAFVAGPLSDTVRYSLSAYSRENDGYIDKIDPTTVGETVGTVAGIDQKSVRAKLEIDITPDLTATLGYLFGETDDPRVNLYSTYDHVASLPPPPFRPTEFGTVAFNDEPMQKSRKNMGTLKLAYETENGILTSYTSYSDGINKGKLDFDGSYVDIVRLEINFDQKTFSQALDYTFSPNDNLDLTVGGMYYRDDLESPPKGGTFFLGNRSSLGDDEFDTEAWALYADGTYHLTDRLDLTLGGRFSSDYKEASFKTLSLDGDLLSQTSDDKTWTDFTPRASFSYALAPRTNIYASITQGFRSGTYNGSGPTPGLPLEPIDPETITAYEIGIKTSQQFYRLSAAAFYYDYKDINVSVTVPNPNCPEGNECVNVTKFDNAPGAEVYGIDLELTLAPAENLNILFGISLLDASYEDFVNATGTGVNAANTRNISNQVQDWSGVQMARAPDYSGNLGFDYLLPTDIGNFLFAANMSFTDSYPINNPSLYGPEAPLELRDKQRFLQDAHELYSARLTWTDPGDRFHITFYGNNLGDYEYPLHYNGGSFGDYSPQAEPLTYGVKVGYSL